jgi:hypothetical protein
MSRLPLFVVASVVLAALLSGCGASTPPAATVGDHQISRADLNRDLRAIRDNKPLGKSTQTPLFTTKGTLDARYTSIWLSQLIQLRVIEDMFDARHLTVTAQDRAAAQQEAEQTFGDPSLFDAFPSSFKTRYIDALARSAALARSELSGAADQQAAQQRLATQFRDELVKAHVKVDPRYGSARIDDQGFQVVPPAAPNPREKPKTTTTTAPSPAGASPSG